MSDAILQIRDLVVGFDTDAGRVVAVDGVNLDAPRGKTLGIVGESGCGKSVTAFSINRLLPQPSGKILGGSIRFEGRELTNLPIDEIRHLRGKEIGMIFQEPMTALNPVHRIGRQLAEAILLHEPNVPPSEVLQRSVKMLEQVRIPSPGERIEAYPHQLSGGMRQRVMIAMALLNRPKLLIADEPTTALDVTVQAQILALIADLQKQMGMSVILITHDLGVIAETCDEVAVMYAGRIVERAPVGELFAAPRHAYTRGLLASIPRMDAEPKTPLKTIPGSVPAIENFNSGCRFADRSGMEHTAAQLNERPPFVEVAPDHWVEACPVCAGDSGVGKSAAIPYPSSYDTRSQRNSAPTLGDALAHLEAGAGAGAAASKDSDREERRRLEFGRLAAWARQNGCLIAAETFRQPEAQGAEHRVFFDEDLGCAIKLTNPNRCGMTFVDGEAEAATPTEYLRRWILHNEIFGDQVMFHGVVEGPSGLCLAVRQTWITGDPPTEDEIVKEMRAFGFESCASAHDYYRRSDGMAVLDAHESNLVRGEDGALFAIDVIPVKAGPELLKRMEVSP